MAKKLKDLPHVLKLFTDYLDNRETKDLASILDRNEEYRNLVNIKSTLFGIDAMIKNSDIPTGNLAVDFAQNYQHLDVEISNFSEKEEIIKEKKTITQYTKTKKDIIDNLLDEPVEEILGYMNGYHKQKVNIINLPNQTIGRLISVDLSLTLGNNTYGNVQANSLYLANAILPVISVGKGSGYYNDDLYFTCSGHFLYKDAVWNPDCENFLHKKFSAKATVKNIVERALLKKMSGQKPDWVCNMEMMS